MAEVGKMWLVALITLDTSKLELTGLPKGCELTAMPNALSAAVAKVLPPEVGGLDTLYLLTEEQRNLVVDVLEQNALDYSEYAVEIRGDPGTSTDDTSCTVIRLCDRRPSPTQETQ